MIDRKRTQLQRLNQLLNELWKGNRFYASKWTEAGLAPGELHSLEELAAFPFTTRDELLLDQQNSTPLGTNLTYPLSDYKRIHRSSGTTRAPIFWADTLQSWRWVMRCSQELFLVAGIKSTDRLLFVLTLSCSSGPWIIYEGACQLGCCCLLAPAEGNACRQLFEDFRPNVLVGKPSALCHLGTSFLANSSRLPSVEKLILTGEPSFTSVRTELQQLWGAHCFDRYGMTEAGSIAGECSAHPGGLHLLEKEFIAEVVSPETSAPVAEGEPGELILTNLGRNARPIIRYRTGDTVRLVRNHACDCGRDDALLLGGIHRLAKDNSF